MYYTTFNPLKFRIPNNSNCGTGAFQIQMSALSYALKTTLNRGIISNNNNNFYNNNNNNNNYYYDYYKLII